MVTVLEIGIIKEKGTVIRMVTVQVMVTVLWMVTVLGIVNILVMVGIDDMTPYILNRQTDAQTDRHYRTKICSATKNDSAQPPPTTSNTNLMSAIAVGDLFLTIL